MADFVGRIKRWFARQERRSLQAEEHHREFDAMTDRVADHKDHMIDRIEDAGESER